MIAATPCPARARAVVTSGASSTACIDEYEAGIARLFKRLDAAPVLKDQNRILIKPNLVNTSPPPVTTPAACVEGLIRCIRAITDVRIIIAEGCGELAYDTFHPMRELGYTDLAARWAVDLVDLNEEDTVRLTHPDCRVFPDFHFPAIGVDSFIISVPVLKAHSLADVTLGMKNMMGFAPPSRYSAGGWKKSLFHRKMDQSIIDLNTHRKPDLTLIDATVGLADYHLGGPECDPPVEKLIAGFDVVETDAFGATLLGRDWRSVGHIAGAHGRLGNADFEVVEC